MGILYSRIGIPAYPFQQERLQHFVSVPQTAYSVKFLCCRYAGVLSDISEGVVASHGRQRRYQHGDVTINNNETRFMLFLTISNGAIDFSVSFCYNVLVQCHCTVRGDAQTISLQKPEAALGQVRSLCRSRFLCVCLRRVAGVSWSWMRVQHRNLL